MVNIKCGDKKFLNIQGIIFDKDGTLANSQSFWRELGIRRARLIDAQIPGIGEPLLMAFGIQDNILDPTGLMAVGTRQENEIAAAAYIAETGRGWLESVAIAKNSFIEADKYLKNRADISPLFTGSLEVIKYLADAGLKLGILSADTTANVEDFVRGYQLSDYIQLAMGCDAGGLVKPNPQLFLKACESLEVSPEKTLMVGDSASDIVMAKQAKAAGAIGICWEQAQIKDLQEADVKITHLEQLELLQ